jgi:murein DD-endopeptidase MepM/ murein hydrolase activator NlpD
MAEFMILVHRASPRLRHLGARVSLSLGMAILVASTGAAASMGSLSALPGTWSVPTLRGPDTTSSEYFDATAPSADVSAIAPIDMVLSAPVPGAKITSPFGWREHPILKRLRFHEGVDFGAPRGTAVLAAQDGVVEEARWHGHYGRLIRIRHSAEVETAYAHLARFAAGLRPGTRVHKGQVIAAVGTSGYATGPHLYYEVLVHGHQVDPELNTRVVLASNGGSAVPSGNSTLR